jgi:excisionase family DNA binding protein
VKTELEPQDIEAISQKVVEALKQYLNGRGQAREDRILDVKGLCRYLSVPTSWVYERTHLKEIPHYKAGNHLRFRQSEIDKWLSTFRVPAVKTGGR